MNRLHRAFWRWMWLTAAQRARWQSVRGGRAVRFVLLRGVLGFGGLLALIGSVGTYLYARRVRAITLQAFPGTADPLPRFLERTVPLTIVVALVAGAVFGTILWLFQEWLHSFPERS